MGQSGAALRTQCELNPDPSISLGMTDEGFSSTGHLGVILSKAKNLFSSHFAKARYELVATFRRACRNRGIDLCKTHGLKPETRKLEIN